MMKRKCGGSINRKKYKYFKEVEGEIKLKFVFNHFNINVLNLEKSIEFYEKALGLKEINRVEAEDGSFILVYMGEGETTFKIELTWIKERVEAYDLGDEEFHLAFSVEDYDSAYKKHKDMQCICFENQEMGIYFINDPDGYWLEIIPSKI